MSISPARPEAAERFLTAAQEQILSARFSDLLAFLAVRSVAPGSAHARFKEAFGEGEAGRQALLAELRESASRNLEPRLATDVDLMRLANDLRDRVTAVGDRIRQVALDEFDRYADDNQRADEIIRALMFAVARSDEECRSLLQERYAAADDLYEQHYAALLNALGREPIPEIGSARELAVVIGAALDGFLIRTAVDPQAATRDLYASTLIPLLGALTHPQGSAPPAETSRLYADLMPSATASLRRTPPWAQPVEVPDHLTGTWRGTMNAEVVARDDPPGPGPRETYLVIDAREDQLQMTNFISTGISRMLFPQLTTVAGGFRVACMYEAELSGNPTPDWPSHRGAWVLEADEQIAELHAIYFNDRSTRGTFIFDSRTEALAETFLEAQDLFGRSAGSVGPG